MASYRLSALLFTAFIASTLTESLFDDEPQEGGSDSRYDQPDPRYDKPDPRYDKTEADDSYPPAIYHGDGSTGGGGAGGGEKCYAGGCGLEMRELLDQVMPGAELSILRRAESALLDEGIVMSSHIKELDPKDFDNMRVPALVKSRLRQWLAHGGQDGTKTGGGASGNADATDKDPAAGAAADGGAGAGGATGAETDPPGAGEAGAGGQTQASEDALYDEL
eukprot:TRINITY_DN63481_c0_g1_i1.p1 TRINITY_DN63481_c0_g1~~TRINITY_DN63481_c0_g1_i1.p1  ORF type:complete len:243 (+),score=69.71 TRINITY_DN63481_c0_g1_i1:68-730(+)